MSTSAPAATAAGDSTLQSEAAFDIRAGRARSDAWSIARGRAHAGHAPQLAPRRQLAFVNPLDAVAERPLDVADVAHEAEQAPDLHRGRLVAPPHRTIERDVALDEGGAQRN